MDYAGEIKGWAKTPKVIWGTDKSGNFKQADFDLSKPNEEFDIEDDIISPATPEFLAGWAEFEKSPEYAYMKKLQKEWEDRHKNKNNSSWVED